MFIVVVFRVMGVELAEILLRLVCLCVCAFQIIIIIM